MTEKVLWYPGLTEMKSATLIRGPCRHPLLDTSGWYVYKRDVCKRWRKKTWALMRALVVLKYMQQVQFRAMVQCTLYRIGLPEDIRKIICRKAMAMTVRNANYFRCTSRLAYGATLSLQNGQYYASSKPMIKLVSGDKKVGFLYKGIF